MIVQFTVDKSVTKDVDECCSNLDLEPKRTEQGEDAEYWIQGPQEDIVVMLNNISERGLYFLVQHFQL